MQYPRDTCTCQRAHLTNQHFRQHYTNNHTVANINPYIIYILKIEPTSFEMPCGLVPQAYALVITGYYEVCKYT